MLMLGRDADESWEAEGGIFDVLQESDNLNLRCWLFSNESKLGLDV
jgi:hypothetical protein